MSNKPEKGFIQKYLVLLLALGIGITAYLFISFPGPHLWEVSVPRALPAARISVPARVDKITLTTEESIPNTKFVLADTDGAVREYWLLQSDPAQLDHLVSCDGGTIADAKDKFKCARTGNTIQIDLDENDGKPNDKRRLFYLLPIYTSSQDTVHAKSAIRFSKIEVEPFQRPRFDILANQCADPDSNEARDKCAIAEEVLGARQPIFVNDPQLWIAGRAKSAAVKLVPAVIFSMIVIDALLVVVVIALIGVWFSGRGLLVRSSSGMVIDVEQVFRGPRRLLEYLEVVGPSVAFTLTCIGLLLAFDRSVFAERDSAGFSSAISLAMAATVVGLIMRYLAFTADKMMEHLIRWNADSNGLIYPDAFKGKVAQDKKQLRSVGVTNRRNKPENKIDDESHEDEEIDAHDAGDMSMKASVTRRKTSSTSNEE